MIFEHFKTESFAFSFLSFKVWRMYVCLYFNYQICLLHLFQFMYLFYSFDTVSFSLDVLNLIMCDIVIMPEIA